MIENPNYLKLPNCTLVDFLKKQNPPSSSFLIKIFSSLQTRDKKISSENHSRGNKNWYELIIEWEVCWLAIEKAAEHHHEQVLGHYYCYYYYYYHTPTTLTTSSYPTLLEKEAEAQMMSKFHGSSFCMKTYTSFLECNFFARFVIRGWSFLPATILPCNSTLKISFLMAILSC